MKSKPFLILVSIAVLIFGLLLIFPPLKHKTSEDEILANQILYKTAKQIELQTNLHPFGTGGRMLYEIKMLGLSFQCFQKLDAATARQMIVYAIDTLLNEINSNEAIRPYLKNYPFTANNVEIEIYCYQPDGSKVPVDDLECISSVDGIIKYYARNSDPNQWGPPILTETYNEAIQLTNTSLRLNPNLE